ncbi:hypothetical protein SH661x_000110 [Planctomicrobium sp. SH661]|uniref:hypothetical protein n=1 Tax=Planctomicrobium sp. SH661 TaxID=3448124 RepID=UPI003F5BDB86
MFQAFHAMRTIIGGEWKVLMFVLAGLVSGEIGMRCIQDKLSVDVGHLRSFGTRANELTEAPLHPHILFLGNSMTRYGVSPEEFDREFTARTGRHPATLKINPDNTALADWFYAYRNYFFEAQHAPDVLVLGFEGGHLRDKPTTHPGRLAQYYCDLGDWPELCRYDLKTFEDRAAYLLCTVSAMCGNRDRLQRRILDMVIPGYRDGSQELNTRQSQLAERKMPAPTYDRLKEFLKMTREQNVTVVLAAMPVAAEYELDPALLDLLKSENIRLIDCRHIPGITSSMFPDGVHMTSDASVLYSRYLADELADEAVATSPTPSVTSTPHSVGH